MNFNQILKSLFGDKSSRDMKLIKPLVEKVKAAYPEIQKLTNDELRAKTKEIQAYIQNSAKQKAQIDELKAKIEDTPIDEREEIFAKIDKLDKEVLDIYEKALDEVMPVAFSIVKDTARRFAENEETVVTATDFDRELAANPKNDFITIDGDKAIYHNHWTAGGNDLKWEMVHYDVQIFGGTVLHQGKIAEMATGEGKTLVATLPVFLNALTGNGVHVVTVNDYLAKRDSEWMGPLYMFNGLSVDCIDKHRPNSPERRKAYRADITFGTNNEFGFDYLRDNMAMSPADLVQRRHNYAIVDEVDSVLIDDARTPLIISGPIPKGDDQMFEQYQPLVERLYEVQRKLATEFLADAKQKISEGTKNNDQKLQDEGFLSLYRSYKCLPKNKPLIKYLSEEGIKAGMLKTEEIYMEIIFDVSYLEIYADGGLETASVCVYPDAPYQVVSTNLPTRVPTGWLSRSTIKTSSCCLISPLRCRLSKTRPLLATRRNFRRRMSSWLTMACRASVYTLSSSCSRLTPCSTKTTNMSLWMAR